VEIESVRRTGSILMCRAIRDVIRERPLL